MRTLLTIVALFVLAVAPAHGQCHSQRSYGYQSYSYYPTYSYASYYAQQTYYPVAVAVPVVAAPYYYSTYDSSRDVLLSEAIAYKVLMGQAIMNQQKQPSAPNPYGGMPKSNGQPPQQDLPSANGPSGPNGASSFATAVNPAFASEVNASCLRCHGGAAVKGGINLSDLGSATLEVRKKVVQQVMSGAMPQGGPAWSIDRQRLAKEWFTDLAAAQ